MDYENILSRKVQDLQFSGIRKFFDIAASYDDVISLSVGGFQDTVGNKKRSNQSS